MTIVIAGATVLTAEGERRVDVEIEGGMVKRLAAGLRADVTLDGSGCHVLPGFVDLHSHLREPGREDAETIATGSRAGVLGGYTALIAMPNTEPAADSVEVIDYVRSRGDAAGLLAVHPSGCITVGREGRALAPLAILAAAGVRIFTDDGNGVQDPALMRRALEYARDLDVTLAQHCEVASLTAGAVMDECRCSGELGLPGWPALAEELMVHRDIELVRLTGSRIHFLHLSTAGSVELVRNAKADGLAVTAEVTPHHLALDHGLLATFDPIYKVNPPLRSPADIAALRAGLADGTIDAVATDHAPHPVRDKERALVDAPPGMLGLQSALGVVGSVCAFDTRRLAEVMSIRPARIAGLDDQGRLPEPGSPANLCVVDLEARWTQSRESIVSRSQNSPYLGRELRGRVRHTISGGRAVVVDGEVVR